MTIRDFTFQPSGVTAPDFGRLQDARWYLRRLLPDRPGRSLTRTECATLVHRADIAIGLADPRPRVIGRAPILPETAAERAARKPVIEQHHSRNFKRSARA